MSRDSADAGPFTVADTIRRRPQRREDLLKESLVSACKNLILLKCAWPGCELDAESQPPFSCRVCGFKFCGDLCLRNHVAEYCGRVEPLSETAKGRIPKIPTFFTSYQALEDGSITLIRRFTFLFDVFIRSFGVKTLPVDHPSPLHSSPENSSSSSTAVSATSAAPATPVTPLSTSSEPHDPANPNGLRRLKGASRWFSPLHALFHPIVENPVLDIMTTALDAHELWEAFCEVDMFKRMSIYYRSLSVFFVQLFYDMCESVQNEPVTLGALLNPPQVEPAEIVSLAFRNQKTEIEKSQKTRRRVAKARAMRIKKGRTAIAEKRPPQFPQDLQRPSRRRNRRHYYDSLLTRFRYELAQQTADNLVYYNDQFWEPERTQFVEDLKRAQEEIAELKVEAAVRKEEYDSLVQMNSLFREEICLLRTDVEKLQEGFLVGEFPELASQPRRVVKCEGSEVVTSISDVLSPEIADELSRDDDDDDDDADVENPPRIDDAEEVVSQKKIE